MAARTPPERAANELRAAGIDPLEPFKNASTPWRSLHRSCGREVSPTLASVRQGKSGCALCGNKVPTQDQFAAQMKEYLCNPLQPYVSSIHPTRFECHRCGLCFTQTRNKILSRRDPGQPACPTCFKVANRQVAIDKLNERLREYATNRGGRVVTDRVDRSKDKAEFECSQLHRWIAQVEQVIHQETWCPNCAGVMPRALEELHNFAEARGGKVLSNKYVNVDAKYDFECNLGHRFSNSFKKIEDGQWCATCNKGRISEEVARTTFEQLFGVQFPKVRPQWLRNSRGRLMEIDGANLDLGIGFEYHGAQHFRTNLYTRDDHQLQQRQEDDTTKEHLCREHGILLVILTHEMTYREFPERIVDQLTAANFDVSEIDVTKAIDLSRAYIRIDRLEELRALMEAKRIDVLSTTWLGTEQSYEMRCRECDYEWSAVGNSFFNRRRVAGCDRCARKRAGERNKLGLQPLVEYARVNSGELLSDTYVRRNHYYRWRCSVGHEFDGNFNNMKHRAQFCPICERRMKRGRRT